MEMINNWLEKIAYYTILMAAVQKVLPGEKYRKYVKFYTSLILASLIFSLIWGETKSGKMTEGSLSDGFFRDIENYIMPREDGDEIKFDKITIGED